MGRDDLRVVVKNVVGQLGYSCWGVEYNAGRRRASLRVFIDHPGGITLDDCSSVSHQLRGVLGVRDLISRDYTLEVSSPGIDRLLLEIDHYRRYVGSKVRISCHAPIDGRKNFVGRIGSVDARNVVLGTDAGDIEIPVDGIRRARLMLEPAKGSVT